MGSSFSSTNMQKLTFYEQFLDLLLGFITLDESMDLHTISNTSLWWELASSITGWQIVSLF